MTTREQRAREHFGAPGTRSHITVEDAAAFAEQEVAAERKIQSDAHDLNEKEWRRIASDWKERYAAQCAGTKSRMEELAAERAAREQAERKLELLRRAINENDPPCDEDCDSWAHTGTCKHVDPAAWLVMQQERLDEARKSWLSCGSEWHEWKRRAEKDAQTAVGAVARADRAEARCKRLADALQGAVDWMSEDGCDCGSDDPRCRLCEARAALKEGQC